jgi:hypothetical protein
MVKQGFYKIFKLMNLWFNKQQAQLMGNAVPLLMSGYAENMKHKDVNVDNQ